MMPRRSLTRGERAIAWVENWCATPSGKAVQLTPEERATLYTVYDAGLPGLSIEGRLAAYVSLLRLVGPEARSDDVQPCIVATDVFTLWNAAGPRLREYLRRHGETVVCDELGTSWSASAA